MNSVQTEIYAAEPSRRMSAYLAWYVTAKPGDELVYHRGFLMADRDTQPDLGSFTDKIFKDATDWPRRTILVQRRVSAPLATQQAGQITERAIEKWRAGLISLEQLGKKIAWICTRYPTENQEEGVFDYVAVMRRASEADRKSF